MSEMQAALRSLISLGKSQGYLVLAEVIEMLPAEIDEDQLNDLFAMFSDMGIVVVNDQLSAAELVAQKTPPMTATTPSVVRPAAGLPIDDPVVALKVGAEGGEIRLIAQELTTGWRYRYSMLDQTSLWLDKGDAESRRQSAWVYDWSDALASLDKYPWAALHPMEVHPRFADRVLQAARDRLARQDSSVHYRQRLTDWSALCLPFGSLD